MEYSLDNFETGYITENLFIRSNFTGMLEVYDGN